MTDYTTLTIKKETKPAFEEAKEAVAVELGDGEPTHNEVIRELAAAYTGHNARGEWREAGDSA